MLSLALACAALLAGAPATNPAPADSRDDYRQQAADAGRDADAQVRLALWCEAHGLAAERLEHLARALLADPAHAAARGLMGLVADAGRWRKPEAVAARVHADAELAAALAEYNSRRAKAPDTAEAQWKLARWCEQRGLKAEATAHLAAVVRLDPKRDAGWRKLGFKKQKDGRWATEEQIAATKAEAEAQGRGNQYWRPTLARWKQQLREAGKRDEASRALSGVSDARAVPSVMRVFGLGDPADQLMAAQLLGQIDAPRASRWLAVLALFSKDERVQGVATETLRRRDPREYADVFIPLVREPIRYEVRPVGGPGSPGAIYVAGERFNRQRLYSPPAMPAFGLGPGDTIIFDAAGFLCIRRVTWIGEVQLDSSSQDVKQADQVRPINLAEAAAVKHFKADESQIMGNYMSHNRGERPRGYLLSSTTTQQQQDVEDIPVGRMMLEYQLTAAAAQEQLARDAAAIEAANDETRRSNEKIVRTLSAATGQTPGDSPKALNGWWLDLLGYSSLTAPEPQRPTLVEEVPLDYQAPVSQPSIVRMEGPASTRASFAPSHVCFGAGTLVRALEGPRPIETLKVGDRVLAQDLATGTLDFRPILRAYHRPPTKTLRIKLGPEAIISSPFHRFWIAGKGWALARELKPGDVIRTLGGQVRVAAVDDDRVQPVFNLDVADDHDFFVGDANALVHDNTVAEPVTQPFDAPAAVAAPAD